MLSYRKLTNTLDYLKNHPPKAAYFNWIFESPGVGRSFRETLSGITRRQGRPTGVEQVADVG
jgi:hypothetical protein